MPRCPPPALLQALLALQQATAFSFGDRRWQSFYHLSHTIEDLAVYAPGVPEEVHWQYVEDMDGESLFLLLFAPLFLAPGAVASAVDV